MPQILTPKDDLVIQILEAGPSRLSLFAVHDHLRGKDLRIGPETRLLVEVIAENPMTAPSLHGVVHVFDNYGILVTGRIASGQFCEGTLSCRVEELSGTLVGGQRTLGNIRLGFSPSGGRTAMLGPHLMSGDVLKSDLSLQWDDEAPAPAKGG